MGSGSLKADRSFSILILRGLNRRGGEACEARVRDRGRRLRQHHPYPCHEGARGGRWEGLVNSRDDLHTASQHGRRHLRAWLRSTRHPNPAHRPLTVRGRGLLATVTVVLLTSIADAAAAAPERAAERQAMVETIREYAGETSFYLGRDRLDERVLKVMGQVPRHEFVLPGRRGEAYENRPLSIGYGQTISQPYVVALMTDLLELDPSHRVLEIGTGSGYQAAVAAELAAQVFTIEIIPELQQRSSELLQTLGYDNVHTRLGDGYYGWPERAPFDAIIVTAAADHIPPPLTRQLRPGGRMVIPVGGRFQVQQLTIVEKDTQGQVTTRQLLPVRFVPLTGSH